MSEMDVLSYVYANHNFASVRYYRATGTFIRTQSPIFHLAHIPPIGP